MKTTIEVSDDIWRHFKSWIALREMSVTNGLQTLIVEGLVCPGWIRAENPREALEVWEHIQVSAHRPPVDEVK